MKIFILCAFLFSLKANAGLFGKDEINVPELREQVKKLIDDQNVEKAEELFKSKLNDEYKWCFIYYPSGKCQNFKNEPPKKEFEEQIKKAKQCEPHVKTCLKKEIDRESAEICIDGIESDCPVSKDYEVGHPNKYSKIIIEMKKKLNDLRYSVEKTPEPFASAYNKCLDNVSWGFIQNDKPKESKIMFYHIKGKQYILGEYKTESDCHEARLNANEKNKADVSDECLKRYVGDDVLIKIYQAKAMFNLGEGSKTKEKIMTFASKEKCELAINQKKPYELENENNDLEIIEIGPYKSSEKNRYISDCKEIVETVCKKNEVGLNKIKYVQ